MTVPAPPTLTPAPSPAPTRADPANFNVRADAYHTWLVPHVNTELPAVFTWMTARQNDVAALAQDAEDQVALAEAAAAAATSAANASIWVSGQTYAVGVVRFSPINFLSYRRKTAGAGTTDPSVDATNWALVAGFGDVTLTGTQTLTNKTVTNLVFDGDYTEDVFTITDGASVDLDPSNGTVQLWTLGASRSPTDTSFASGQSMTLMVDDGSDYAITWPSVVWKTDGGSAPTLNTSGYTVIQLWKVSTVLYGARVGDA
jgi:hypothetical protein